MFLKREGYKMKHSGALVLLSIDLLVAACSKADMHPSKWYFTAYENRRFIFEHDHKKYTAECMNSFSTTSRQPDAVPDCSFVLTMPGIGNELPERMFPGRKDGWISWYSQGNVGTYTPAGDKGPQFSFEFVSITESR
jgi:hypothetical protein